MHSGKDFPNFTDQIMVKLGKSYREYFKQPGNIVQFSVLKDSNELMQGIN